MTKQFRVNNHTFNRDLAIVADTNSVGYDVGRADSFSILVAVADNGSGAGSIALEASLDNTTYVELSSSSTTIAFVSSAQNMLFTVQNPAYRYVRVAATVSAGDIDVVSNITVTEGSR